MRADGESGAVKVGNQALFMIHGRERGGSIGFGVLFEKRAGGADGAFYLPESVAAVKRFFTTEAPFDSAQGRRRNVKNC
jgi:hypothetical protein